MKKVLLIAICLLLTGCINNYKNINHSEIKNNTNEIKKNDIKVSEIKVTINEKEYKINLEDNKTVEEFLSVLPKEYTMNDLNNNEKYVYIDNSLTTNSYNPKHIEKGDVMIFGDNCLVIFYKSFDTSYSYTKIGHINDLKDIGNNNVVVKFEI